MIKPGRIFLDEDVLRIQNEVARYEKQREKEAAEVEVTQDGKGIHDERSDGSM